MDVSARKTENKDILISKTSPIKAVVKIVTFNVSF